MKDPRDGSHLRFNALMVKQCVACEGFTIWLKNALIYPRNSATAPPPNPDMPEEIRADYDEARSIADLSPRGAATLLRFALQRLLQQLAGHKGGVNDLIHELEEEGMDPRIGDMFHGVRIIGDNGAHPLEIDLNDNPGLVAASFHLLNAIVDDRISKPKREAEIYAQLPPKALEGVEARRRGAARKRENQSA